jgi:hypothetical protein
MVTESEWLVSEVEALGDHLTALMEERPLRRRPRRAQRLTGAGL